MPYKSQTMFKYKNRRPNDISKEEASEISKRQSLGKYYRKERCPEDCNNTYTVNDVVGNVRTCPKVIGGSSRCVPLSGNTMINANVSTNSDGQPSKKYYTSNAEYMQARCKRIRQNEFNIYNDDGTYKSNCCGNDAGYVSGTCNKVVYKPNNKPFSTQGAVSSSTRLMRLKYNAIAKVPKPTGQRYPPNYNTNSNMVKDAFCTKRPLINKKNSC